MRRRTVNKSDLINVVTDRLKGLSHRDVEIIVNQVFDAMSKSLQTGDRIEIRGFGSFEVRNRKPRIGRNPKTGETVSVIERKVPFFKVGKELRERVDNA